MLWSVTRVQMVSVSEPFRSDAALTNGALRLVFRAEFFGVLPDPGVSELTVGTIQAVAKCLAAAGLPVPVDAVDADPESVDWSSLIERLNDQVEMSPYPPGEWPPALDVLGEDLLARLLGVSVSSVRRYSAGGRVTPQPVAERLHFLALVLADLAGSYNDYGMRRWFTRPRSALGDRRPVEVMGEFDPESVDAHRVRALAARLVGAGAAA